MILGLSESCPLFTSDAESHLQRLLYNITLESWHLIATPGPDRLKAILPSHLWQLYGDVLIQSYKQTVSSPMTVAIIPDCGHCNPDRLVAFLTLPVAVIVEDIHSDAEWFKAVANTLRPRLARRMTGTRPSIEFKHAGGISQIPNEIERLAAIYRRMRLAEHLPLRVVAISDSDAKLPGAPSSQARAVQSTAAREGIDAHVLRKRTIENYVPDDTLLAYASVRREKLSAANYITKFNGKARDHYPMKDGITEHEIEEVGGLYGRSPQLNVGMGEFMRDLLTHFYQLIEMRPLRQRDQDSELEILLDLVERNL
jgi:hypothetical protein